MDLKTFKEQLHIKYKDQMYRYLGKSGFALKKQSDGRRGSLKSVSEVENYKKEIKKAFTSGLNSEIFSEKVSSAEKTGVLKKDGYEIEKVILTTDRGVKITTNIYKPLGIKGKIPAILFLCGHSYEGKAFDDYQIVEIELVRAGFLVFAVDAIGQGERFTYYNDGTKGYDIDGCIFEHAYFGAKAAMTGKWLYNYFMRDMLVALDYLCAIPEVDAERIGVTGNSGGGTQTSYLMLMQDERLKAFAPATFITDYMTFYRTKSTQDDEQIVPGIIGAGFSYPDIVVSVCPKPVMLLGVNKDFFPIEGMAESYLKAKKVYELYGKKENLTLAIDHSTHRYTVGLAKCAAKFFAEHLMGNKDYENDNYEYALDKWENLNCLCGGQTTLAGAKLPDGEIRDFYLKNRSHDLKKAKDALAGMVYRDRRIDVESVARPVKYRVADVDVSAYLLNPLKGLKNVLCVYSSRAGAKRENKNVLYLCDGGNAAAENDKLVKEYVDAGYDVFVPDTVNYGYLKPDVYTEFGVYDSFGTNYYFAHHFFFRGDCYAAFKSFELIYILKYMEKYFGAPQLIIGNGLIENNLAVALFTEDSALPVKFVKKCISMEKIITERFYDDKDIRSAVYPGLALLADFDEIVSTLNVVK